MNSNPLSAQRDRNRALLVLIVVLFLGSALVAGALRFSGWRPTGMQNKGELLDPPADLRALSPRLAEGGPARAHMPRAVVLVPTRELAMQVSDSLEPLVHVSGLRIKLVAGGLSYTGQTAALDKGVDVLIATPGRLVDLLDRGALTLDEVEVAVLDEADHMADMGFLPDVTRILDDCADGGQRLLFSATLDRGVGDLVDRYMSDPVTHSTDEAAASVSTMDHHLLLIEPNIKKQITARIASRLERPVVTTSSIRITGVPGCSRKPRRSSKVPVGRSTNIESTPSARASS